MDEWRNYLNIHTRTIRQIERWILMMFESKMVKTIGTFGCKVYPQNNYSFYYHYLFWNTSQMQIIIIKMVTTSKPILAWTLLWPPSLHLRRYISDFFLFCFFSRSKSIIRCIHNNEIIAVEFGDIMGNTGSEYMGKTWR